MTDPKQQLQDQIKALKDEYGALLPERLNELDSAFADLPDDIRATAARQALETLCALAHKFTGSAGTFGFMAISEAAAKPWPAWWRRYGRRRRKTPTRELAFRRFCFENFFQIVWNGNGFAGLEIKKNVGAAGGGRSGTQNRRATSLDARA